MTIQAQRRAKKTVSAMMVLVLRNEVDDDDSCTGNRTGTVSSTAISGILRRDLAFTNMGFAETEASNLLLLISELSALQFMVDT